MSAVGIGLVWMALATAAFMVLSSTAIAHGRWDLEGQSTEESSGASGALITASGAQTFASGATWLREAATADSNVSVAPCPRCHRALACAGSSSPTRSTSWERGWPM
jgi:hypothetical protein